MKDIITDKNKKDLIEKLLLTMDETSEYVLVEKDKIGLANHINIYFTIDELDKARDLLIKSGYYSKNADHMLGKHNGAYTLIQLKDIKYIEGINNDTYVHLESGEYTIKEKLYELEKSLYSKKFVRISKSYIVSLHHIKKIKPSFNGKLILQLNNNIELEVSRHYLSSFRSYLGM